MNTPVALIIFKRPDTTEKVFSAIREVKPQKLLVIADGPRSDIKEEVAKCQAARSVIDRVDWDCEVITNYSDINLGCKQRVASGLEWVFSLVEEAIILEDDCLPDPSFFGFCEELLDRFRNDERIMHISGNNFQFGREVTEDSYYFSRYNHIWGWATWRRAWQLYDVRMELWPKLRNSDWLLGFLKDRKAAEFWKFGFEGSYQDWINTWDLAWTFACWIHNGLSIIPQKNLVKNIGLNSEATFTKKEISQHPLYLDPPPMEEIKFPLVHPSAMMRNDAADMFTEKMIFSGTGPDMKKKTESRDRELAKAIAALNANHNEEALEILESAIAAGPEMPGLYYGRAIAQARLGQIEQAIDSLNRLLTVTPTHTKAQLLLKELRPGSAGELIQKAQLALQANKVNEAFRWLNQAKSLKPKIIGIDYWRAICFQRMNQPAAAVQALYEELRYSPSNNEAKTILEQLLEQYPQLVASNIDNPEFQALLQIVRPYTMLSEARLYSLFSLAKQVCEYNIPGNFVECGVAGGGSTALMAAVIQKYTKQPRWLYAFDSFEGMPEPTEADKSNGVPAELTGWGTGTCAAPEASMREVCAKLGVERIAIPVKGYFQDTLPKMRNAVGTIALLHADGDWYESTKAILENLYDRVSNDGIIQVDDYGAWEGCRQAVHEFEASRHLKFDLNQIDYTGVWFACPDKFPVNPTLDEALLRDFAADDPVAYGIQSQMSRNERFQLYYTLRQLLPESTSPLRFVEIGSFAGSSLFLICQALKRIAPQLQGYAIDPGGHPQLQRVLEHLQNEVTHLRMFSHQAVPQLKQIFAQDEPPPFMFIDGDHSYEGVRQDILNYYPLLAPGGMMLFHDYLPPLNQENQEAILFHHGGKEPGIRQACEELMENTYGCELVELPLLYPTDPTQTQAHLPIIPGVFSTIRAYRKPQN
ncbi:MAG: hypothetical protein Fur0025_27930 [Oscillatoriaceae cyanobacterium]